MTHTAVASFSVVDLPAGQRNLVGLAGVSTEAQDVQVERDALTEASCARIFEEKISSREK